MMWLTDRGWVHQRPLKTSAAAFGRTGKQPNHVFLLLSPWPWGLSDFLGVPWTLGHGHWLKAGSQRWSGHNQLTVSGCGSAGQYMTIRCGVSPKPQEPQTLEEGEEELLQ